MPNVDRCSIKRLVWQWFTYQGPEKWYARAISRRLGVSHTYFQKLVREFVADPSKIEQAVRSTHPATFDQLSRAQEETEQQKMRGWLRPPRRWSVAVFKIGDEVVRALAPTNASSRVIRVPHEVPIWANGPTYYSAENPCDPLVAVNHPLQRSRERQPIPRWFGRRWRPGRPQY
jgi:hypothetical protein